MITIVTYSSPLIQANTPRNSKIDIKDTISICEYNPLKTNNDNLEIKNKVKNKRLM